jgi:hypothetical protein
MGEADTGIAIRSSFGEKIGGTGDLEDAFLAVVGD